MSQPVQLEARRSPRSRMILLGLIVLTSLFLLLIPISESDPAFIRRLEYGARFSGGAGLLFSVWMLWGLRSKPIMLTITPDGIFYAPWSKQTVAWDDIKRINIQQAGMQKVVCIHLLDAGAYDIAKKQLMANKVNKASGDFGDMNIMAFTIDRTLDEIVAAISSYKAVEAG